VTIWSQWIRYSNHVYSFIIIIMTRPTRMSKYQSQRSGTHTPTYG